MTNANKLYGSWANDNLTFEHSVLFAVKTVTSEKKLACEPKPPDEKTAASANPGLQPTACAKGTTIGIATAYKPHDDAVV